MIPGELLIFVTLSLIPFDKFVANAESKSSGLIIDSSYSSRS